MGKPYFDSGPFQGSEGQINYHWTMADLLNALTDAGLTLSKIRETPAKPRYWEGWPELLDWKVNPLAGLPVWLIVAAQKPG
jgi:hypothetical protein